MDKILIIQDSPSINAMLELRLRAGGFAVEAVETGEDGLRRAKEKQFQLILLDYNLPGIDGAEVCRILRKEENTGDIPIVFISAIDKDEMRELTKDTGADDCIAVPFEGEELIKKIKTLIFANKNKHQ